MNNTTNSWEEKDPEPISAQIEGWERKMLERGYDLKDPLCDYIRTEISTAHRNGVEEGKGIAFKKSLVLKEYAADQCTPTCGQNFAAKEIKKRLLALREKVDNVG
jgi:hypothetical protein